MVPLHTILCRWKICFAGPVAFCRVFFMFRTSLVSCKNYSHYRLEFYGHFYEFIHFLTLFFSNRFQSRNPICLQMSKPSGLRYRILEFGIWNNQKHAHQNYQHVWKQGYVTKWFQLVKFMYSEKATVFAKSPPLFFKNTSETFKFKPNSNLSLDLAHLKFKFSLHFSKRFQKVPKPSKM